MTSTVPFLRERLTRAPRAVLVLGSGLGALADTVEDPVRIPYAEIPGFPRSTGEGHAGELVVGVLNGVEGAVMAGGLHLDAAWDAAAGAAPMSTSGARGA